MKIPYICSRKEEENGTVTNCHQLKTNYMSNNEPGYAYILINPSFREDWVKIGHSSPPLDVKNSKYTLKQ